MQFAAGFPPRDRPQLELPEDLQWEGELRYCSQLLLLVTSQLSAPPQTRGFFKKANCSLNLPQEIQFQSKWYQNGEGERYKMKHAFLQAGLGCYHF